MEKRNNIAGGNQNLLGSKPVLTLIRRYSI